MLTFIQHYLPEIFIIVFGLIIFLQFLYYFALFARFTFHKSKKIKDYHQDPVSIVITAKDEAHHLLKSLPVLLNQQYNNYEVVIVNDNSADETNQIILEYKTKYPHLKLVDLNSSVTTIKGKKFPLSLGIKSASHEIILLTDADCVPSSPYWLQNMAKHFIDRTEIVLGYGSYEKKSGFLNLLIHFDALHTAIQYFSYSLAKMSYMGVGRNLAYTKTLFLKQKGFASHNHIKYGDDDIFIGRAATKKNCDIEYFKETYTISRPKSSFKRWFEEKRGHAVSQRFYHKKQRFLLACYNLLITLFYLFFLLSIVFNWHNSMLLIVVMSMFFFKTAVQYAIFGLSAAKLSEKGVIPYILLFDIIFAVLNPFIYLASVFSKNK